MRINDRIYGETNVEDALVEDILASPFFARLRGVDQAGYARPFFKASFSRFEHSLGVFVLLRRHGAPREEQIAGLIHDISHTAFSHCVDYAVSEGSQKHHSHQDDVFLSYLASTDIPAIISRHGMDPAYLSDSDHFPLQEQLLPDLCADRIDYSLRQAMAMAYLTPLACKELLSRLSADGERWVFDTRDAAMKYARLFAALNREIWSGVSSAVMFITTGMYLRRALDRSYITKEDLFTTDAIVLEKIVRHHAADHELVKLFRRMDGKTPYQLQRSSSALQVFCKSRAVDPLFRENDRVMRLSEVNAEWGNHVREESKPKEYWISFND